jgi:hypothetical protein
MKLSKRRLPSFFLNMLCIAYLDAIREQLQFGSSLRSARATMDVYNRTAGGNFYFNLPILEMEKNK